MKNKFLSFLLVFMAMVLVSCGESSSPKETPEDKKTVVSGVVQKGPFLQGSIAKIFKLDSDYVRTLQMLQTTISSDDGSYSFDDISWSGFSEIEVTGRFLNENTGLDTQSATVTSVVNVLADGTVNTNVNVLTHMASAKVKELLKEGKTLDEANEQVVGEVFNILGRTDLWVDDFGDLNLEDILGSNATANTELLFLSAALLRSDDYMADLEALLALYKDGGIDAILGSEIYARLMQNRQEIDESAIVANINEDVTEDQIAQIKVPSMAQITKSILSNIIELRLYGTKFTSTTPNITFSVTGGTVTKGEIVVSDDNKSATISVSGDTGGCKDVYVVAQIDYNHLSNASSDINSNSLNMHPTSVICQDRSDDDSTQVPITPINNRPPVAIIGSINNAENGQQAPQSITVAVGAVVYGLQTYHSYDQTPYPNGGITHCEYKDEDDEVIRSSNNNRCSIHNKIFDTAGEYIYTLTVTDNRGTINSNTVTINVEGNHIPELTLNPNTTQNIIVNETISITATATDADEGDTLNYIWSFERVGGSDSTRAGGSPNFSHSFQTAGEYLIILSVSDSQGARVSKQVSVVVSNPSDELPVAKINDSNTTVNLEIYAGNAPHSIMVGGTDDNGIAYCKWSHNDATVYENTIAIPRTDLEYHDCEFSFPTLSTAGEYIYTLTLRDTAGQEDSNDLNVTVLTNATPTANIGANRNITAGSTLTITATANDADGDDLTYQWMYGVKDSGSMTGAGNTIDFSHQFDDVGLYEVTFRVADEHNANITVNIDVNVTEATVPVGTVVVGDLMWEDTVHTRDVTVANWAAAETYCADLELSSLDDWRLSGTDELSAIMDSNDTTTKAIIDGFVQFNSDAGVTSWTNKKSGTSEHMVGLFTGSNWNLDGFGDDRSGVGVRCVRDAQ